MNIPPRHYDVAVVGAGPAGLAAASFCARARFSTVVIDAGPEPGGHAFRGVASTPLLRHAILGEHLRSGEALVRELAESGATFLGNTRVTRLGAEGEIHLDAGGEPLALHATYVMVATGAREAEVSIPGRGLEGVGLVRPALADLVASGSPPTGRVVLAGSGALLWEAADRLAAGGAQVAAVLDTTPLVAARAAWRHFPVFLLSAQAGEYFRRRSRVRRAARVVEGVRAVEALGDGRLREVRFRDARGETATGPADMLLLHEGLVPEVALAEAAGVPMRRDAARGDSVPEVGPFGATSVPGIFVVGDAAGIVGPQTAAWQGVLAAADVVHTRDPAAAKKGAALATTALRAFARGRPFLERRHSPGRVNG